RRGEVSAALRLLVSAQEVPSRRGVFWQPKAGSQVSVVQTFESLQLSGVPAVHVLLWQVSAPLHTLPSLHAVPFATPVNAHPEAGLQVSGVHGLLSLQTSAGPEGQTPDSQVSAPFQTFA